MKKIMFNDKYGLTQAVLAGRKTQTRRIINATEGELDPCYFNGTLRSVLSKGHAIAYFPTYKVGEEVAIAQRYLDFRKTNGDVTDEFYKLCCEKYMPLECLRSHAGAKNKMFVDPKLMPHRIRITNVRVERLQDISDEDCLKEGIIEKPIGTTPAYWVLDVGFSNIRHAFRNLIDKTCGRGTWHRNPYVFVYDFELVK